MTDPDEDRDGSTDSTPRRDSVKPKTPESEWLIPMGLRIVLGYLAFFFIFMLVILLNKEVNGENGENSPLPDLPGVPSIDGVPIIPG